MSDKIDAIICGSCVLDIIARPVDLHQPIMGGSLHAVETPAALAGGITSNTGIAMARQGLRVGVASYVGEDRWGGVIRQTLDDEGIDSSLLLTHDTAPTSTTIVLVDQHGERSFLHAQGAPKQIDAGFFLDRLDAFTRANWIVLGYYPLIPKLIDDLPNVFEKIRQGGSRVMLESAGGLDRGGAMRPLDRVLAQVDAYIPSLDEAVCQTGLSAADDPRRMIEVYRRHTGQVLLGIKLGGERGVLLSPSADAFVLVPSVPAPGRVIDTTGAGDCFLAGLLTGLIRGLPMEDAGTMGCRVAAQCVTGVGGWASVNKQA